jgi:hypothetical protein
MGMMNLFQKIFSIFPTGKSLNLKPLEFGKSAIEKIQLQIQSRPTNIKSCFQIQLSFKPHKVEYRVGFIEDTGQSTLFSYPVPVFMSNFDEKYLQNCTIEFDDSSGNFLVFPDVTISARDTPSKHIINFIINKIIISDSSTFQELALDRKKLLEYNQISLFQELLKIESIQSIYINKNSISVEYKDPKDSEIKEAETADLLLKYFTDFGYPLEVSIDKIKTYIPVQKN